MKPSDIAQDILRHEADRRRLVAMIHNAEDDDVIVVLINHSSEDNWTWAHNLSSTPLQAVAIAQKFIDRIMNLAMNGFSR